MALPMTPAVLILLHLLKLSEGELVDVLTDGVNIYPDDTTTELSLLWDLLDTRYTPQCLRVVILYFGVDRNSTGEKGGHTISDTLFAQPARKYSSIRQKGRFDILKPKINIMASLTNIYPVIDAIRYINHKIASVNSQACVTYMLPRPPDPQLFLELTDVATKKMITRNFLVRTQNYSDAERFLQDSRLRKEENVAALVQEESQNKSYWRVLIRQLLHPSGSPQVLTVNRWSRDTGLTSTENIFPEQMANFYGQKLTGVTLDHIPFSDFQRFPGSLYIKFKPCVDLYLINTIARQLNFTYQMKMPADGEWGFLNKEGHFVGVVGDVEFERANFAFDLSVTLDRARLVDFTQYYFFDGLTFITAKSRPDPLWRKLITPFRGYVWLCVLVSVGGGSLLYHVIYHAQVTLTSSHILSSRAFMRIWASFFSQSLHNYLSLQAGKIFLGFWFLYAFLVTTYYKTSLTSTLAVPFAPPTIDTLQELLQSGLSFGMKTAKGSAYALFSTSEVPLYKHMFQQMTFHTTPENMRKVAEGDYSYVYFRSHVTLLVAMHNNNPKRKSDIHIATEEFFPSGYGCAVPKGSPYLRTFNAVMQRCLEAGLIRQWIKDVLPNFLKEPQEEMPVEEALGEEEVVAESESKEVVLNLNHLQGPFFLLFLGKVGGAVLLLLEILAHGGIPVF